MWEGGGTQERRLIPGVLLYLTSLYFLAESRRGVRRNLTCFHETWEQPQGATLLTLLFGSASWGNLVGEESAAVLVQSAFCAFF